MTLRTFNTEAEMMDYLVDRGKRGDAALKVWQRDLTRGQYAFRLVMNQTRAPWPIFWEVLTGPTAAQTRTMPDSHRVVVAFSELDIAGRTQTVHVGDAWGVIDKDLFDLAREVDWRLPPTLRARFQFAFDHHAKMQQSNAAAMAAKPRG